MSFKLIAIGNSKRIMDYLRMMQLNSIYEMKLIYKQPIDKEELLVVWNCKQRYHAETFRFSLIYVQAQSQDGVESFRLRDTEVIDLGNGFVHIKGRLV